MPTKTYWFKADHSDPTTGLVWRAGVTDRVTDEPLQGRLEAATGPAGERVVIDLGSDFVLRDDFNSWPLSAAVLTFLDQVNQPGMRAAGLGLGTVATQNIGTSGGNVPMLDAANSWGGAQTIPAVIVTTGGENLSDQAARIRVGNSTAGIHGIAITRNSTASASAMRTMMSFWGNDGIGIGSITSGASAVTYNTTSDYRLKENVEDLAAQPALDAILSMRPVRYTFIGSDPNEEHFGYIAHEAQEYVPRAVTGEKDGYSPVGVLRDESGEVVYTETIEPEEGDWPTGYTWTQTGTRMDLQGMDYSKIVPLLHAALIVQQHTIAALRGRIEALEGDT